MAVEDIGIRVVILGVGEARRSLGSVRSDLSGMERQIRGLSRTSATLGKDITQLGHTLVGFGRTLTLAVTTPLLGLGAALVGAGIGFEDAFSGVTKTVDEVSLGFVDVIKQSPTVNALFEQYYQGLLRIDNAGQKLTREDAMGNWIAGLSDGAKDAIFAAEIFGDLTEEGKIFRKSLIDLSLEIPISASELARLGEIGGQLGVPFGENGIILTEFVKTMALLGVTTDLTSEQAATDFARLANIYGIKAEDMVEWTKGVGATVVALGNTVAANEPEILNLARRMASASAMAGISEEDMLGFAASLAAVGVRSEMGGTAISRMLSEMTQAINTGSESLEIFGMITGKTNEEFKAAFKEDALGTLLEFSQGLYTMSEAGLVSEQMMTDMGISGVRVQDVLRLMNLTQEDVAQNIHFARVARMQQIALEEEAAKKFKTIKSQLIILKNTFAALGTEIFDLYRDKIQNLIAGIQGVIVWFTNLTDENKRVLVTFGLLAAAAGPLIIVLGIFLQNLGLLITTMSSVPAMGLKIIGFFASLGTALLPIIAIAGALYLAWETNFLGIRDLVSSLVESFKSSGVLEFGTAITDSLKKGDFVGAWASLKEGFNTFVGWLKNEALPLVEKWAIEAADTIMSAISAVIELLPSNLEEVESVLSTALSGLIDSLLTEEQKTALNSTVDTLTEKFGELQTFLSQALSPIGEGLEELSEGVKGFFDAFAEEIDIEQLKKALEAVITFVGGLLAVTAEIGGELIGGIFSTLADALPLLGSAIAQLINAVTGVLTLDFEGASESFLGFIEKLMAISATLALGSLETLAIILGDILTHILAFAGVDVLPDEIKDIIITPFFDAAEEMVSIFDIGNPLGITKPISEFVANIIGWLGDLPFELELNLLKPFDNTFIDANEKIDIFIDDLTGLPRRVAKALAEFGNVIRTQILNPVFEHLNPAIEKVKELIGTFKRLLGLSMDRGTITAEEQDLLGMGSAGMPASPLGSFPTGIKEQARGGVLSGMGLVGELGPELIMPKSPVSIFPNTLTSRILESINMSNQMGNSLLRTLVQDRVPANNTSVYSPVFNASPTRDMVSSNMSLYDQWLMAQQRT